MALRGDRRAGADHRRVRVPGRQRADRHQVGPVVRLAVAGRDHRRRDRLRVPLHRPGPPPRPRLPADAPVRPGPDACSRTTGRWRTPSASSCRRPRRPWERLGGQPLPACLALPLRPGAGLPRRVPDEITSSPRSSGRSAGATRWSGAGPTSSGRGVARVGPGQAPFRNDRRTLMNPLHLPWLELGDRGHAGRLAVRQPAPRPQPGLPLGPGVHRALVRLRLPGVAGLLRAASPPRSSLRLEPAAAPLRPAGLRARRAERPAGAGDRPAPLPDGAGHRADAHAAVLVLLVAGRRGDPPGDVQLQGALGPRSACWPSRRCRLRRAAEPRPADPGVRAAHGACSSACWSWAGRPSRPAARPRAGPWWATVPLLLAILVRCGTVPAHCWLTDWFEHASLGIALLYVTPLSGVYAAVRLVLPIAPGLGPAAASALVSLAHGRLRRRDGHDPARGPAVLRLPVPEPRVARAGRAGAAHRALADRLALPLVLGDPLAGRLRPDAPRPGGPLRPALADRLPRPLRATRRPWPSASC